MAEGGVQPKGRGFNVEKAWEHLLFQTRDKETTYEADADFIEPCRLQFVLKSKLASGEFYTRIGKQQIFKILSSEHVGVEVDSSELADIDGFWSSLIKSVNRALGSKVVQSFKFLSKKELETALLNLDEYTQRLITTGVVGVYYTYDNTSCVAKFVGSDYDTRYLCEKICEIMKKKFILEHQLEQREVKAMLDLGLAVYVQEGFEDVTIQVDEDKSVVRFQGFEKGRIDNCVSDLIVWIGRVQFILLDFLSNSTQQLLRKKNLRKYIQEKVNVERIAFVTEGQYDYMCLVCRKQKKIADLKSSIQNCLTEMIIDRNCLHSSQWKDFFEKHGNEIIREDHEEKTCLCFTSDLKEGVEKLLLSFGKPCSRVVRDFLQTFGTNLLKDLAEKHHVREEIQEDYVCFKGLYNDGKNAMNELERHLEISVLHFDYDEGCLFTSQKIQHLDAIGKRYRCGINAITFSQDPHTIWNKSDTGVEYLAKWKLYRNKGQISVAEVDFEKAELDGLIIPVNECLYGEDIFGKANEERSYKVHCRSQGHKFELGQWEPLVFGKKYRGASCVALVSSGTAIVDKKQIHSTIGSKLRESVTEIIHDSFSKGLWKIGFAIPSNNHDFRSKLDDILSGYQDVVDKFRGHNESELLVCVKQPAERWLQEVDYRLSWTVCTRRQVGPRYYGLFDKPQVNIEVTRKSLLEVKTNCLVVAISKDLDLSRGRVSKLISEACGEELQQELQSKHQHSTILGEPLAVDSFNLSEQGVKKLIFGSLPVWKRHRKCDHILEHFVQECLLLAESYGCSSVAFPVLGTGNLAFPLRDAVVALIDGIDRYIAETTDGNISTVYIAVADDTAAKILDLELKRRKANSDVDVKQSQIEDHTYHFAEDGNVKCYIANETVFRALSSGRHIEVLFTPLEGKNLNMQDDSGVPERIVKTSGNSKNDLKLAFEGVIKMCEKDRITSVAVHCSQDFSFSETEEVDTLLLAAQQTVYGFNKDEYPVRGQYKYLEHVFVVTSAAGYSMISNLKLADETQLETSSSFLQSLKSSIWNSPTKTEMKWKRMNLKKQKVFLNVILAGGMESDLKKATHDIVNLCTTADISGDSTEFTDEVTAELNLGIVKYLKNLPEPEFKHWKHSLYESYSVLLKESESCNSLLITGLFDDILKTEHYLENEFPSLPSADNKIFEKVSQRNDDKQVVKFTIPIKIKDKLTILRCFPEKVEALSADEQIIECSTSEAGITIKCVQLVKEDVELKIQQLISDAKDLDSKTATQSHDKSGHDLALEYQVKENICFSNKQKTNKQHDVFLYKRASFKFNNVLVGVCQADITDFKADCIVSPENEQMSHEFGVAKAIAEKAGHQYVKECKEVLKQIKSIALTDCVNTGSGDLQSEHVLHVHTPVKLNKKQVKEQLVQITDSVKHCLEKAGQLKATSIVFPFLCAGMSGFPPELCAQQYFRALKSFKPEEHLRDVTFVNLKKESVSRVCQKMTECMNPDDMNISQTSSELSLEDMNVFIQQGLISAVSSDAVVVNVDESLNGNDELDNILCLTSQNFKIAYDHEKKRKHTWNSVVAIKADGQLTNRFVLFAVTPVRKSDPENYAKYIRITTQHILEKTCELQQTRLAMPVLCNSEDAEVLSCCCQAMAESLIDFGRNNRNKIKMIQLLTKQEKAVSAMCHAMAAKLKSMSGCAGSVEV